MSDCFLIRNKQLSALSWQEQVRFWRDDDNDGRFVLDQNSELDFYSASSLKQKSADRHLAPLGHIIPSHPIFAITPECCVLIGKEEIAFL